MSRLLTYIPTLESPTEPSLVEKLHGFYERNKRDTLYLHNDVTIHEEGWMERLESEFYSDPRIAIVGFGGALGIGTRDIFRKPYHIHQLQRIDYYSNVTDWEVHGKLQQGSMDAAVVDGFAMAVRADFLKQVGGWKAVNSNYHVYDVALCLLAHRYGWRVRMVGIDCTHHGGGTSTRQIYHDWCAAHNTTPEREHAEPHVRLYENFRDLLPFRVKEEK